MPRWLRPRAPYIALALITVVLGLAVHWHGAPLGETVRDVLGDTLWAAMIFWWVSAIAPRTAIAATALAALAICFVVEGSQLLHAPALEAMRDTSLGHLLLGSDFDARDLLAYAAGVLAAALVRRATRA